MLRVEQSQTRSEPLENTKLLYTGLELKCSSTEDEVSMTASQDETDGLVKTSPLILSYPHKD